MNKNLVLSLIFLFFTVELWAAEVIVYSRLSEDGYWQVWRMSPDGTGHRQITHSKRDKREVSSLVDGRLIYRDNNGKVFICDQDCSSEREILAKYQKVNNPQFFRDGKTVLFTRFDPRSKDIRDIWKTDISGESSSILTRDNKLALQPSLSPDETSVVFTKREDNGNDHHIWVMDVDGNNAVRLTKGEEQDLFPRFSPDGQWVTFSSDRKDGNFEIYVVNVKSKALKRLTQHDGVDSHSCFSPDGQRIVFVSNRSGSQEVWGMDKDGKNPVPLTGGPGESIEPYWADINEERKP